MMKYNAIIFYHIKPLQTLQLARYTEEFCYSCNYKADNN